MPPSSCNCRQLHMRMNAHSTKASQQTLQAAQNRACARNRAPWSALRGWRAGCGRLRMDGLHRSLFDAPHCGIQLQVAECMKDINREHWNRVVWESGGEGCTNPFLSWEFLNALEESESAHKDTGWAPQHLLAYDQESGEMVGCVPQYLKAHSYGEYVFDHTWARAYRMFSVNAQTSSVCSIYAGYGTTTHGTRRTRASKTRDFLSGISDPNSLQQKRHQQCARDLSNQKRVGGDGARRYSV